METEHSPKYTIDKCTVINFPIVAIQSKPNAAIRASKKSICIIPESGKGTAPTT